MVKIRKWKVDAPALLRPFTAAAGGGGVVGAGGEGEGTVVGLKQAPPSQICPVGQTCRQPRHNLSWLVMFTKMTNKACFRWHHWSERRPPTW